jgi:hypothetical protein
MDKIDLAELSGYQEDFETLNKFQRPYLLPSLGAIILALCGFLLFIAEMQASHFQRGQKAGSLDTVWFDYEGALKGVGAPGSLISCLPAILFFGGLAAFATTMFVMSRATPVSCVSGQRMEKYWNATPDQPSDREIVYVDRTSRTYFRRVFSSTSGPRTPVSGI